MRLPGQAITGGPGTGRGVIGASPQPAIRASANASVREKRRFNVVQGVNM
jgi:hypothetical protein